MGVSEFIDQLSAMVTAAVKNLLQQIKFARADGKISGWEYFQIVQSGTFSFVPIIQFIIQFARDADNEEMNKVVEEYDKVA